MRYTGYASYQRAEVGWVEAIPEHWRTGNLRRFAQMKTGHTPSRNEPEYWQDCEIPWFTLADVWQLRDDHQMYLKETKERISSLGLKNSAAELLPKGTVIFSRTASIGFSGIMPIPMATTQDFWNWIPGRKLLSPYLLYMFRSMRQEFERITMGSTHKTIYQPDAARLCICVPPLEEQRAIADFLDRETAKVDTLVAKKGELIEKLKEKRSALISRTVTRGLPPEAAAKAGLEPHPKLKASGSEWVSDIPEGWTTRRLRHISDVITVGVVVNPSSYVADEGVPFLLGGDVREFCIDTRSCNRCRPEVSDGPLRKSRLASDDLVVVRVGYPGVAAVVPPELEGANCASMMIVRKHLRFSSQWLAYAFNSQIGRDQIDIVQYGAAQKQFNISHAVDFVFPFPPLTDQRAIADFLDRETAKIDRMVAKVEEAIERLQEYRSALITAAVTGKIDVRGLGSGSAPVAEVELASGAET